MKGKWGTEMTCLDFGHPGPKGKARGFRCFGDPLCSLILFDS